MPDTYKIGTTLGGMQELGAILSPEGAVFDPDSSFQDFATAIELADGTLKGQGFPVAKWRFKFLSDENRQVLKSYITGLSGPVFIHTPTNESDLYGVMIWDDFSAIMKWTEEDEDKQAAKTLDLLITFTHLVAQ
jgi:hypothetical protein